MPMRKFQQGDVVLQEVSDEELTDPYYRSKDTIPGHAVAREYTGDCRLILAEGEVTGHFHKIDLSKSDKMCTVKQLRRNSEVFFHIQHGRAAILHEEHATIMVPPGLYRRKIVQEADHLSGFTRVVTD